MSVRCPQAHTRSPYVAGARKALGCAPRAPCLRKQLLQGTKRDCSAPCWKCIRSRSTPQGKLISVTARSTTRLPASQRPEPGSIEPKLDPLDQLKEEDTSTSQRPPAEAPSANTSEDPERTVGVKVALALLNFYKREISPVLPPSCRFLPTCSEYGMESYKRYGVAKGTILTAWRLLNCNPLGRKPGYDPVQWPPPDLGWLFKN